MMKHNNKIKMRKEKWLRGSLDLKQEIRQALKIIQTMNKQIIHLNMKRGPLKGFEWEI